MKLPPMTDIFCSFFEDLHEESGVLGVEEGLDEAVLVQSRIHQHALHLTFTPNSYQQTAVAHQEVKIWVITLVNETPYQHVLQVRAAPQWAARPSASAPRSAPSSHSPPHRTPSATSPATHKSTHPMKPSSSGRSEPRSGHASCQVQNEAIQ